MAAVAYRVDTSGQYLVVYKIIVIFGNLLKFCSDYTSRRVEDMRNYGRTRTAVETAAGLVAGHPLHNDASSLLMAFDMALWWRVAYTVAQKVIETTCLIVHIFA